MNWQKGKFEQDGDQYRVLSFDLLGIDTLWKIALSTDNLKVGDSAITMLNRLYMCLSPDLANQIDSQRELFLARCIGNLNVAKEISPNNPNNDYIEKSINRNIYIIQGFIAAFEKHRYKRTDRHGALYRTATWSLPVIHQSDSSSKYDINVFDTDSVGELRTKISEELKIPIDSFKLTVNGKLLSDDSAILKYSDIRDSRAYIYVHSSNLYPIQEVIPKDDSFLLPSTILSEKYFDQLFQLLNYPLAESTCLRLWDIIENFMPTNERIKHMLTVLQLYPSYQIQILN